MPVTDQEQLVREALVTIVNGHAGIQTLTGRVTKNLVERDTLALGVALPVLAYDLLTVDYGSGDADLLVTAIAEGANAGAACRALLEQAALALTWAAFSAAGVQVVTQGLGVRRSVDEVEDVRERLDLDSPTLTQADWSIRLLIL